MKFLTQHDYIMKRLLALFTLLLPFIAGGGQYAGPNSGRDSYQFE